MSCQATATRRRRPWLRAQPAPRTGRAPEDGVSAIGPAPPACPANRACSGRVYPGIHRRSPSARAVVGQRQRGCGREVCTRNARYVLRASATSSGIDLRLDPGSVVVGENRSGKSNLIHALGLVLDTSLSIADRQLDRDDFWDGLATGPTTGTRCRQATSSKWRSKSSTSPTTPARWPHSLAAWSMRARRACA